MTLKHKRDPAQRLLNHMYAELVAARSLFMDGFLGQAALHLVSAWHTLGCLQAQEQGKDPPALPPLAVDLATLPNGPRLARQEALWSESLEAIQRFSPAAAPQDWIEQHTDLQDAPRASRKRFLILLRFQLKAAEETYQKLAWQQRRRALRRVLTNRRIKLLAGAGLLGLLIVGVGMFWNAGGVAITSPRSGKVAPPPPPASAIKAVKLADVQKPVEEGTAFDAEGNTHFADAVEVDLGKVMAAPGVELSLDNNDDYRVVFLKGAVEVGAVLTPMNAKISGLRVARVKAPEEAVKAGYDTVRVLFLKGDTIHVLGHLRLLEE